MDTLDSVAKEEDLNDAVAHDRVAKHVLRERNLDPENWNQFSELCHRALDEMIAHIRDAEDRPVWQPMPEMVRRRFKSGLPHSGRELADLLAIFRTDIRPYATGNIHPLFMGWVHGAGTPVGMLAEMLSAGLNANCGGRNHVGIEVERQIVRWSAEMFGYPGDASGVFVTGTSMANFLALLVARNNAMGHEVRGHGLHAGGAQLTAYASSQAHGCISQALEMAGIGSKNLRLLSTDPQGALCVDELRSSIAEDRACGNLPFLVIGTAGTVNTGTFDRLDAIADVAEQEKLWFHIDGAFGALAALSPKLRPLLSGIERSHSVAFDFHKWAHVPYDAGFLLVRDARAHRATFSRPAAYLERLPRGLALGETWPCDLGPDLSRGFRALKTWFTFQALGADRIGACIEQCCSVATYLGKRLQRETWCHLAAPVTLNIVCFKIRNVSDQTHKAVVMELQERGIAVPSMTTINGQLVIRVAIVNHRTTLRHADKFIEGIKSVMLAHQLPC